MATNGINKKIAGALSGLAVSVAIFSRAPSAIAGDIDPPPPIVEGVPVWVPLATAALTLVVAPSITTLLKSRTESTTGSLSYAWRTAENTQAALLASKDSQIAALVQEVRRQRIEIKQLQVALDKEQATAYTCKMDAQKSEQEKRGLLRRLKNYEPITEDNDK